MGTQLVDQLPSENKRCALIIGVDKYRDDISQLNGSVNDAKALREMLVNYDKPTGQYRGFFSYAIEEGLKGQAANEKGEITLGGLISYIERTVRQSVYVEKNQTQIPYPITEGYKNAELVLARSGNSKTPASAWSKFKATAQNLLKYDDGDSFSEGLAWVTLNGKEGFIDKTGREVIPVKYDDIWCYAFKKEGFIGVKLNGKKGFVDLDGNEYFDF